MCDQKQMRRAKCLIKCKLERFLKNNYISDSYSLSNSFREQLAFINHLASRPIKSSCIPLANLVKAMTVMQDLVAALSRAEIKNVGGEHEQGKEFVGKAEKLSKLNKQGPPTSRCRGCHCLESPAMNIARSTHQKGCSQVPAYFYAEKSQIVIQGPVLYSDNAVFHTAASVRDIKRWRRRKRLSASCPICQISPQQTFFSVPE